MYYAIVSSGTLRNLPPTVVLTTLLNSLIVIFPSLFLLNIGFAFATFHALSFLVSKT